MIKEFSKGHHQDDLDLQENYLDWFFLTNFGKSSDYWRSLTDDEITSLITLQNEKEKGYWDNWSKMLKGLFGK